MLNNRTSELQLLKCRLESRWRLARQAIHVCSYKKFRSMNNIFMIHCIPTGFSYKKPTSGPFSKSFLTYGNIQVLKVSKINDQN